VLVKLLRKVAMKNATILCTIHQPSSDVFAQFDSVNFIKDGRVFYQGSAWEVNLYYNFLGHKCRENYNPADFVMNLSQSLSGKERH
jgi:ABC-type multidrug transport system ATPase subunit